MRNQLIPPPELAPPSIGHLSPEERILLYARMVDEGDALVAAALRREIGPEGDLAAAVRAWLDRRADEKIREMQAVAEARRREQRRDAFPDEPPPEKT
jgi:hypothetical protein